MKYNKSPTDATARADFEREVLRRAVVFWMRTVRRDARVSGRRLAALDSAASWRRRSPRRFALATSAYGAAVIELANDREALTRAIALHDAVRS